MGKSQSARVHGEDNGWAPRLALAVMGIPLVAGPTGYLKLPAIPTFYDHQRFLELFSLLFLGLLVPIIPALRRKVGEILSALGEGPQLGLALFFALGLASAVTATLPSAAFLEYGFFLLALGAAFAVAGSRSLLGGEGDIWLLVLPLTGVAFYTGQFLEMYLPTTRYPDVTIFWDSPFFHFGNARFLNQLQTWTLPLIAAAGLLAGTHSRILKGLLVSLGGFWWSLLFATGGRGALVATAIAALITIMVFRGQSFRWAGTYLAMAGVGALFYLLLFHLPGGAPGVERAVEKGSAPGHSRLDLWAEAFRSGVLNPLTGVGPMHLAQGPVDKITHPHNSLLQLFAEWGAPATLLAVGLVIFGLLSWSRNWRQAAWTVPPGPPAWAEGIPPAITAALLGGLGHSLVSGIAVMPLSQGMAIMITGWALGIQFSRPAQSPATSPHAVPALPQIVIVGISLIGLISVAPGAGNSLAHLSEAHKAYRQKTEPFHPRFWYQGNLCYPPWTSSPAGACPSESTQPSAEKAP